MLLTELVFFVQQSTWALENGWTKDISCQLEDGFELN